MAATEKVTKTEIGLLVFTGLFLCVLLGLSAGDRGLVATGSVAVETETQLPPEEPDVSPLDVNTATAAELEQLPGIGPALAGRIVAHRETHGPFAATADLEQVQGIGPAKLAELDGYVTAGDKREDNR